RPQSAFRSHYTVMPFWSIRAFTKSLKSEKPRARGAESPSPISSEYRPARRRISTCEKNDARRVFIAFVVRLAFEECPLTNRQRRLKQRMTTIADQFERLGELIESGLANLTK